MTPSPVAPATGAWNWCGSDWFPVAVPVSSFKTWLPFSASSPAATHFECVNRIARNRINR